MWVVKQKYLMYFEILLKYKIIKIIRFKFHCIILRRFYKMIRNNRGKNKNKKFIIMNK